MESDVINLRDQVAVMRRRWRVVVLCILLGVGAAFAYSQTQHLSYVATAEVLISPTGAGDSRQAEVVPPEEIATQVEVITSATVAARARDELGLPSDDETLLDSVTVAPIEDTRVLTITAERDTAGGAADVANAFAHAYLQERQETASEQTKLTLESLQTRYDEVRSQLKDVQAQKAKVEDLSKTTLESQEQALTVQLTGLLSQLAEASSQANANPAGSQVLKQATAPSQPAQSNLMLVGAALGVLLGLGLAFVRDHFDDAIRDESRLRSVVSKPVLGHIPQWGGSDRDRLVTLLDPQAPAGEAYRSLSSSVRFLLAASRKGEGGQEAEHRTLLVTSAEPGEGKTTVACNLAVAAARFGLRVILVDADLRRPGVAPCFGLGNPPGLSDMLSDGAEVDAYLVDVGTEGLQLLPGGSIPPNPAELLASPAAQRVLAELHARADLVIIDSAPVSRVADTRELMPSVDLVLLVVRRAVTRTRRLTETVERIRQAGGTVSGTVFNGTASRGERNSYQYGYSPGSDQKRRRGGRKSRSAAPKHTSGPARSAGGDSTSRAGAAQAEQPDTGEPAKALDAETAQR